MKGNQTIIKGLNELLSYELAAMDQYFIHSQMYLDWGLTKLYERIDHEFDDERGHATKLIERMLFLILHCRFEVQVAWCCLTFYI